MPVISANDLAELRRDTAARTTVSYTKQIINAALQAIEDTMEAARPAISNAIDNATTPFVFTGAQKKILFAVWARQKFNREGV